MPDRARHIGIYLVLALVVTAVVAGYSARADEATSTDFDARQQAITSGGGISSSTDFTLINAEGPVIAGRSSSTNFRMESGPLEFDAFAPASENWRWYDDESNETPASPLAAENTAPSNVTDQDVVKLRLTVKETAGIGEAGAKFKLQYSTASDFSTGATDVTEIGSCAANSGWCYANASGTDDTVISAEVLSDAGSCAGGVGAGCGTHNTSGVTTSTFTQSASTATEYEFTIKSSGPSVGTTYFFRAWDVVQGIPVPPYATSTYPNLVTAGATLTLSVSGLSSGTTTEGITTDASATATSVPFGALAVNVDRKAAQRLTVTTNASQGYEIYMAENQNFIDQRADVMPGINATNPSPAGWNSACNSTSTGCIGYHAGDDVLAGGSTRFSANDSYARLETALREVGYSSTPASSRTTDIVFRAAAHVTQAAGSYQTNVDYVVVPTY